MLTYNEFQQKNVSEKIVLVKAKAAKRLLGFSVYSGSVYSLSDFDFPIISEITDSGVALTSVGSVASVVAGTFFNDVQNKILYIRVSDSTHPNGKFLSMRFWNFYSSVGVAAPYDLASGEDVYWEPYVRSTSDFGNELDNEEQLGFAIEGAGQVVLQNDRGYWDERFEQWVWDQMPCYIYSWSTSLPITEAKPIYQGKIIGKAFSSSGVTFRLKDQLLALREPLPMDDLSTLPGAIIPDALLPAKQRRIYGRLAGNRPTNIDQVVDGYVMDGTIDVTSGSATVTGSGTFFRDLLNPDDEIVLTIFGEDETFTVASITSNTSMTLTEAVDISLSAQPLIVQPARPKRWINRTWLVAGHECNQPTRSVTSVFNLNRFTLSDVTDIVVGDELLIGSEVVTVNRILGNDIKLAQNLIGIVMAGDSVVRPAVQNVRWNDKKLIFNRDYTISFSGGRTYLELDEEFEKNLRSVRSLNGTVNFTSSSAAVTGVGTQFTSQLEPGGWIRSVGQFDFFEILSIESDTALTLRSGATYTEIDGAQYLGGSNFDTETDVISCEVTGTTDTGLYTGDLLKNGAEIVEDILSKVSITNINATSFSKSMAIAPYTCGFIVPATFEANNVPKVRDLINNVNLSIFGSLVQNEDLELEYNILRPNKPPDAVLFEEADILSFSIESSNERVAKKAIIQYQNKEYDFSSGLSGPLLMEKMSDVGSYLVQSTQDRIVATVLFYENDARILASRWAFLLELGTNVIKVETKLKAARLQVNDVVKISHEKLFERVGGGKVKYAAVQAIKKNGSRVSLELDDLSNMFNRVCIIAESGAPEFDDSNLTQKAAWGFITDSYGLIGNDIQTANLNLIW